VDQRFQSQGPRERHGSGVEALLDEVNLSKDTVHRIWRAAGVKPHRVDRYMTSNDPDFETNAADVIGLYLNPPQHAAIFCVDEKFARIEREVIARGIFTSVKDLARKIMRYIRAYAKDARPIRWKYSDVTRRINLC
jgi:hypothetical protein